MLARFELDEDQKEEKRLKSQAENKKVKEKIDKWVRDNNLIYIGPSGYYDASHLYQDEKNHKTYKVSALSDTMEVMEGLWWSKTLRCRCMGSPNTVTLNKW